jgi:hypothetical protein
VGLRENLAAVDSFEQHLVKVYAGHRKRKTRALHLITSHGTMASILALVHGMGVPQYILVGLLLSFYFQKAPGRWVLPIAAASTVGICLHVYTAFFASASITRDLSVFLLFGLPEHFSHAWFDDGAKQLVTRGRRGFDKVFAILTDVIALGPMTFLCLNEADFLGVGAESLSDLEQKGERLLQSLSHAEKRDR